MARVFITGSADGLGKLAAKALIEQGHQVVVHARNEERAREVMAAIPDAEHVFVADLADIDAVRKLAEEANVSGHFDAVIHNAGIYSAPPEQMFTVNCLAPYVLTSLMDRPERLVYLSSGSHRNGQIDVENMMQTATYSDSKLLLLLFSKAVARLWPEVSANAVDPGWVPTKMGGSGAPDDLQQGYETQVWLAIGDDADAKKSGRYLYHEQEADYLPVADDTEIQDAYLAQCAEITRLPFPG